jgi:hypothetical protein
VTKIQTSKKEEMKERKRKERGEILNEDGREIGWMKEIWKGQDVKKKGWGIERKMQESESP